MALKKVVLVGANGNLGPSILNALLSSNFQVTVLSRSSSKSVYPDAVHVVIIPDDPSTEQLVPSLRNQDCVVVAFSGSIIDLQLRLADAAVVAGVKRFMPADFGSCDSSDPRALSLIPLYVTKQKVRQHLEKLAADNNGFSWTSLVCGHFFDHGLASGLLAIDIKEHRAKIFDGGNTKWSATTLSTIAAAVTKVFLHEDETKNRMLYIQSFCISQNQLLESLKIAGIKEWKIENVDSEAYIRELKAETDKDPHNREATENLVGVVGMLDANWETKDDFANQLLGLESEDLNETVQKVKTESQSTQ